MVVKCEVEYVGEQISEDTFYAGTEIKGEIKVSSDETHEVQEILLELCGTATTIWLEKGFLTNAQIFSGEDNFLSSLIYFHKTKGDDNKYILKTGQSSFQFKFQIPENCPTSFEGRNGSISYVLKFKLISPATGVQIFNFGLQILQPTDFNFNYPQLLMPCSTMAYRTFFCGSCKTDPLEIKLSLPKTTYAPGDVIPVTLMVVNNTFMGVSALELSFVRSVRCLSMQPTRHSCIDRTVLSKVKSNSIPRRSSRSFTLSLTVPATPPTTLTQSNLIKILYNVTVEAKMFAFQRGQTLTLPLTITSEQQGKSDFVVSQQPKMQLTRIPGSLNLAFVTDEVTLQK